MEFLQNQQYLTLTLFFYTLTYLAFTLNFVDKVTLLIFHAEFTLTLHDLIKIKNHLTCINVQKNISCSDD